MPESTLERYEKALRGEPITEENQRLLSGERPKVEPIRRLPLDIYEEEDDDLLRELTRAERVALKEFRASKAWPVMERLYARTFQMDKKAAIAFSQQSPLENGAKIAELWAMLNAFKGITTRIQNMVLAEINTLDKTRAGNEDVLGGQKTERQGAGAKPTALRHGSGGWDQPALHLRDDRGGDPGEGRQDDHERAVRGAEGDGVGSIAAGNGGRRP